MATLCMEKKLLDDINIEPIISDLHQEMLEETFKAICITYLICHCFWMHLNVINNIWCIFIIIIIVMSILRARVSISPWIPKISEPPR
jgi:hypothetical protein